MTRTEVKVEDFGKVVIYRNDGEGQENSVTVTIVIVDENGFERTRTTYYKDEQGNFRESKG